MIKSAIATAVVAATTVTTIADVKVYGRVRVAAVCTDDGTNSECALEDRSSRFGIKASSEISDGLTAFGRYEFRVNAERASLASAAGANGKKVGSNENEESKIFIEPQGFCVMAGIGVEGGYAKRALDSVYEHLDTEHGIVLNQPPYSKYDPDLGEISSYPPGYKENAGIFCHNNPWIACAETELGRGNKAFDVYKKIAPAYTEHISEIHKTEPYVYSQMIAGKDAKNFGQAKNSWLTGTAAWNFITITQWILGIKPDYDGLKIEPCIPKDLKSYHVYREYR